MSENVAYVGFGIGFLLLVALAVVAKALDPRTYFADDRVLPGNEGIRRGRAGAYWVRPDDGTWVAGGE